MLSKLNLSAPLGVMDWGLWWFHEGFNVTKYTSQVRKALIDRAIEKAGGNMTKASKLVGITPQALSQEKRKQP